MRSGGPFTLVPHLPVCPQQPVGGKVGKLVALLGGMGDWAEGGIRSWTGEGVIDATGGQLQESPIWIFLQQIKADRRGGEEAEFQLLQRGSHREKVPVIAPPHPLSCSWSDSHCCPGPPDELMGPRPNTGELAVPPYQCPRFFCTYDGEWTVYLFDISFIYMHCNSTVVQRNAWTD